jgi:hypothetical protein
MLAGPHPDCHSTVVLQMAPPVCYPKGRAAGERREAEPTAQCDTSRVPRSPRPPALVEPDAPSDSVRLLSWTPSINWLSDYRDWPAERIHAAVGYRRAKAPTAA